jgi:hypothetical protein
MLKGYGDKALEESATRADEFVAAGDDNGAISPHIEQAHPDRPTGHQPPALHKITPRISYLEAAPRSR